MNKSRNAFHSKYGGMWIDRTNAAEILSQKEMADDLKAAIHKFILDGYVVLPKAVPAHLIDIFLEKIDNSFVHGNCNILYQNHGSPVTLPLEIPTDPIDARVVDAYCAIPEAVSILSNPRLTQFLRAIFDEDPLLFQSLSFHQGSQQGLHQDTAYVVSDRPMELAACWIALEDIRDGAGELSYAPGSHRLPDWDFGVAPPRKHWDSALDGVEQHDRWAAWLREQVEKTEQGVQKFHARKGDILIWHADLVHGGSPILDKTLTRRSLVGHFCPKSARPNYFDIPPYRSVVKESKGLSYSSLHYDLTKINNKSLFANMIAKIIPTRFRPVQK
jgi:phytanoyl-CoA hydroxylase